MLPHKESINSPFAPLLQICSSSFCVPFPFISYDINNFSVFFMHIESAVDIIIIFFLGQIYL